MEDNHTEVHHSEGKKYHREDERDEIPQGQKNRSNTRVIQELKRYKNT